MDKETLKFIDRVFKDLYKSPEVLKHSSGNETEKYKNLEEYMDKLESVHEKATKSKERIKTIKRMYHNKYVIKRENIPDSYFELQKRIALERGFGHVNISEHERELLENEVINNQISSLDTWIDYFISDDAKFYPFWAKYWAFQGMLKMGVFDKEKGTFSRRTNETTAPFIDLNREALSLSIDLVKKLINKETIEDRDLEIIVKSGSFPKIYQYILIKILDNNENILKRDQGIWVKYNRGSDPMPLVKSLQGYNTGWCTAGETTARSQLSKGDFYVYYTLDENNRYKVPRIAIRMENDRIGEIRGIGKKQNIESNMEKVVEEKLKEFPDRDKYYKKVEDMKKLTTIYEKHKEKQELTTEELRFLYEIDSKIKGFGYITDPRIAEIIYERSPKKDLSKIFNCKEKQISFNYEKIFQDTVYYQGNLDLSELKTTKNLFLPKAIGGDLDLSGLKTAKGLILPETVGGDLKLNGLTTAKDLKLPKVIGGDLDMFGLTTAKDLILPETVGRDLDLSGLITFEGLELPKTIGGDLDLSGLETAEGLILPETVGGDLSLNGLKIAKGLVLPKVIGGDLNLNGLTTGKDLILPENVGDYIALGGLTTGKYLIIPKKLKAYIDLGILKNAEGLMLPENGEGIYDLSGLETTEGLNLPDSIEGSLSLSGLTTAKDLKLPKTIGGDLDMFGLTTAKDLVLPETVGGDLDLSGLITIEGLELPKNIGGYLDLSGLTTAKGLKLPKTIKGNLYLKALTTTEGLELPDTVEGSLYLNGLTTAKGLKLPKIVGRDLNLIGLTAAKLYQQPAAWPVLLNNLASDGFLFPEKIGGYVFLNNVIIRHEEFEEYRNNNKSKRKIG